MKKAILVITILMSSILFCQSTYTEFKKAYKETTKNHKLVNDTSDDFTDAIDAYESGQNPIFKRLVKNNKVLPIC